MQEIRILGHFIMYLNVVSDEFTRKLHELFFFSLCSISINMVYLIIIQTSWYNTEVHVHNNSHMHDQYSIWYSINSLEHIPHTPYICSHLYSDRPAMLTISTSAHKWKAPDPQC